MNKQVEHIELSNNKIGDGVFYQCGLLTSVNAPNCATIGNRAFYSCSNLTTVNLPKCTTISSYTFAYCGNLTTVSLPKCTTIGSFAFDYCSKLTSISLPSCTTVSNNAFYYCTTLTSISLPNCVLVGENAFYNCSTLTTIDLPKCTTLTGAIASGETKVTLYPCIQSIGEFGAKTATLKFMHSAGDTVLFSDASFLVQATKSKNARTYVIYTNNPRISSMCAARANSYTTVSIYSF